MCAGDYLCVAIDIGKAIRATLAIALLLTTSSAGLGCCVKQQGCADSLLLRLLLLSRPHGLLCIV